MDVVNMAILHLEAGRLFYSTMTSRLKWSFLFWVRNSSILQAENILLHNMYKWVRKNYINKSRNHSYTHSIGCAQISQWTPWTWYKHGTTVTLATSLSILYQTRISTEIAGVAVWTLAFFQTLHGFNVVPLGVNSVLLVCYLSMHVV